ncbi:unnamed protein product [Closterium sp. NIES-53]
MSSIDFVAEAIVRRATTSAGADSDFCEQGRRSVQRARPQVSVHARDIGYFEDENMLPSLLAQSDYAMAFDTLQRLVEATHMLDVAYRFHFDERLLRPHQMVGTTAVEQQNRRVRLHSGHDRLEDLASLRHQRDCRLHHANHRAQRLPVASAFAAGVVGVLRRRRLLRCLLLLARFSS